MTSQSALDKGVHEGQHTSEDKETPHCGGKYPDEHKGPVKAGNLI